MAAVSVQLDVAGNSGMTASLGAAVHIAMSPAGNSAFSATPSVAAHMVLSLAGNSGFTAVVLEMKPFIPPPSPPQTSLGGSVDQFPGLRVGRLPPVRTENPIVNPNPPRNRTPPEEPKR